MSQDICLVRKLFFATLTLVVFIYFLASMHILHMSSQVVTSFEVFFACFTGVLVLDFSFFSTFTFSYLSLSALGFLFDFYLHGLHFCEVSHCCVY